MMRMAMEQMKNMTPEQMAEMSRMAASMGPAQMAEAQRMMGGMTPSQMAEMQQAASGVGGGMGMPASAAPPARPLQPDLSVASAAVKTAAELKEAGNKLHQAGKHDAAIRKYQRALDSLAGDSSPAGKAVAKACSLNLGACTLKLGRNEECVEHCTRVLDEDGSNHKALYRRGQALLGKDDAAAAVADLQKAVRLAPAGDRPIMQPALDRARQQLPAGTTQEGEVTIEEITDAAAPQQPQMQMPAGLGDPAEAARYAQMMRDNPALAKMSENMLQGMSQEQLDAIAKSVGRPPIRKEEAMQAMRNMTPGQFEALAQQEFTAGQAPTAQQLSRTAAQLKDNPAMLQRSLDMMRGMSQQQLEAAARAAGLPAAAITPDRLADMQRQTASMSPEQLNQLASHAAAAHAANAGSPLLAQPSAADQKQPASQAQAAPSSAAVAAPASSPSQPLPGGGMFTPEMMQAASSMMSSMTPEDMAAMTAMAGSMGAAGGPSMGADGMPQISPELMAKMQTPEMMKSMQGMMKSMPADQLAAMMSQQGMKVSPEQAEQMKTQMDNLSERQMWWLMTFATAAQRALAAAQRAHAYLAANPAIAGAVALAVVLVLLRWLGYL